MSATTAVIMAGGSGTRFWPLSRPDRPKQLLPLGPNGEVLLRATIDRIAPVVGLENVLVVTNERLVALTREEIPELAEATVLAEPIGRNTAPCIAWAAAHVSRRDPEGVLVVLPADHHVSDVPAFHRTVATAVAAAEEGNLVTIGIRPGRAETGYGYIEVGEEIGEGVHRARRFVEKPNKNRAEQFLAAGNYLWNSGMFFFRADRVIAELRAHLPRVGEAVAEIASAIDRGEERETIARLFPSLPSVSIDHGLMEKVDRVAVVPGDFGWSDVGSWESAHELAKKDADDNALPRDAIAVDSRGCYVHVEGKKTVALVGVENVIVVDTGTELLVLDRSRAQDVRKVVDALERRRS
jgi:mannose-1-phosphate guanylyltransferase